MSKRISRISALLALWQFSVIFAPGAAQADQNSRAQGMRVGQSASAARRYAIFNINNLTVWTRADGYFARHSVIGEGARFPRGTAQVVYQDGIVWGAKAYRDSAKTQPAPFGQLIRAGGSTYDSSTRAGRIIGFGAGAVPADSTAVEARVYRIRRDYYFMAEEQLRRDAAESYGRGLSEVTQAHLQAIKQQYAQDWSEWPVAFGAPFIDRNHNGVYEPPPSFDSSFTPDDLIKGRYDEPGIANADQNVPADQVIWTVYNDLDRERTRQFAGSEPLGLEVQVTLWGYKTREKWNGYFYRKTKFINKGGAVVSEDGGKGAFWIDDMYFAQWVDVDLGDFSDDLVGCDTLLNLGYVYNAAAIDAEFREFDLAPPSVGYCILQGPRARAANETAFYDMREIDGWKNLPMTAFICHASGDPFSEPFRSRNYDEATILWYRLLRGFAPIASAAELYYPFPEGMTPGPIVLSGDPVTGTGFVDGSREYWPYTASERRMQIHSGPFSLAPGDTQEVVVAFAAGLGADRLSSITTMKHVARQLQLWYPYKPDFSRDSLAQHDEPPLPSYLTLSQNYPNPFNGSTRIDYTIPQAAQVSLIIYDLTGREIVVLQDSQQEAGYYHALWDGRDKNGRSASSGIYFYRLRAAQLELTRELLLLR